LAKNCGQRCGGGVETKIAAGETKSESLLDVGVEVAAAMESGLQPVHLVARGQARARERKISCAAAAASAPTLKSELVVPMGEKVNFYWRDLEAIILLLISNCIIYYV
jgi:hypothetical protein